jgi:FkbM family methyltransferase
MLSKALYRRVRHNPIIERVQVELRRGRAVAFPEIDLIVPLSTDDIVIDAGANVGDIVSRCARTGATVHAFEPNPACFDIISRRFAFVPNVKLHKLGLMDRDCELRLGTPSPHDQYDAIDMTLSSSFVAPPVGEMEYEVVRCIDIAAFIEALDRPVALLKMDIEGAEIPVLNHLLDTGAMERVSIAVVETHERLGEVLAEGTTKLRQRIEEHGLCDRIRLDWV